MGLSGSLGLDWKLVLAQIVNFGLLLCLLTRFLYKPIVAKIEKDEQTLKKARTQVRALERQKKDFAGEKKREVKVAKQRVKEIIKEAEDIAMNIKNRARQEAEQEKQAVIRQIHTRLKEIEDEQGDK